MTPETHSDDITAELRVALEALAVLDVMAVERCPAEDCPLCGPAFPLAA
jgi:hypothetical protein